MREQCAKLSRGHDLAKAMNYIFKRWASFTRFLDDGPVCLRTMPPKERRCAARIGQKVVVILWIRPRRAPTLVVTDGELVDLRKTSDVCVQRCPVQDLCVWNPTG
ncbi:hypothetical protein ABMB68_009827 [Bradyrhizobium sp. RT4a]